MLPIDRILSGLDGAKQAGDGKWMARCPAHEDRGPSLSLRELPSGDCLIYCFAGCAPSAIMSAIGLSLADLYVDRAVDREAIPPPPPPPRDRLAAPEAIDAAQRAADLWHAAAKVGRSPYLERKGIAGDAAHYPIRYLHGGAIILPMLRYDLPRERALIGAQIIDAAGGKRFLTGSALKGSALRLGPNPGPVMILCEGLATALSIRLAVPDEVPVFAAWNAGNLLPAGEILRTRYPDAAMLIAADDDPTPRNPGMRAAARAAWRLGADISYPLLDRRHTQGKISDYNDWHAQGGIEPLRAHFWRILKAAWPAAEHG